MILENARPSWREVPQLQGKREGLERCMGVQAERGVCIAVSVLKAGRRLEVVVGLRGCHADGNQAEF